MGLSCSDIILIIISFFFPPLTVILKSGCGTDLCINLLLTILFFFLGTIHAICVVYKKNEEYIRLEEQNNASSNINNRIVIVLPEGNAKVTNNTIPDNLPPPSYAESEQLNNEKNKLNFSNLPSYQATSSGEVPK